MICSSGLVVKELSPDLASPSGNMLVTFINFALVFFSIVFAIQQQS